MTMESDERQLDRMRELASIGAGHAANSLARLLGRPIWMGVPKLHPLNQDRVPVASQAIAEEGGSGVFFELEGGINGMVALVFTAQSIAPLVRKMLGDDADISNEASRSVMREIGNILVSSHASAMADTLGTRILPSVPLLTEEDLPKALTAAIGFRAHESMGFVIESELFDAEGEVRTFLLMMASAGAGGSGV
jgi:chemotaxis protein CheY-P-specific phosphatase CheC